MSERRWTPASIDRARARAAYTPGRTDRRPGRPQRDQISRGGRVRTLAVPGNSSRDAAEIRLKQQIAVALAALQSPPASRRASWVVQRGRRTPPARSAAGALKSAAISTSSPPADPPPSNFSDRPTPLWSGRLVAGPNIGYFTKGVRRIFVRGVMGQCPLAARGEEENFEN